MTSTALALYRFFSGFGIPAYVTDNIPDNAQMPYITYDLLEPIPFTRGVLNASVWYRDTGYAAISAKVDEIAAAIDSGVSLRTSSGALHLYRERGGAWCKMRNDPNRETKRAYLSMIIIANTD